MHQHHLNQSCVLPQLPDKRQRQKHWVEEYIISALVSPHNNVHIASWVSQSTLHGQMFCFASGHEWSSHKMSRHSSESWASSFETGSLGKGPDNRDGLAYTDHNYCINKVWWVQNETHFKLKLQYRGQSPQGLLRLLQGLKVKSQCFITLGWQSKHWVATWVELKASCRKTIHKFRWFQMLRNTYLACRTSFHSVDPSVFAKTFPRHHSQLQCTRIALDG